MDKITEFMNTFSLEKYIPKLDTVTGWVQWLISLAVRVGPLCILVLGLIYLLIPPKEANHKAGYRTYFGMGSVMAWRFTQRVAGILMSVIGLVLTILAYSAIGKFGEMDLMEMGNKAFSLIKTQVICALAVYVFMALLTAVMFNRKGERRFGGKENTAPARNASPVAADDVQEAAEEEAIEEVPLMEYEKQGEQVITADDIVIEGLD